MNAKYFLFFLLWCAMHTLQAQCPIDPTLRFRYENDVKKVALSNLTTAHLQSPQPDFDSIAIPDHWQAPVWESFAAIYAEQSIAERDTVFDVYCIHRNLFNSLGGVHLGIIFLDNTNGWTFGGLGNLVQTGNQTLDSLLLLHGFVDGGTVFPQYRSIKTTMAINFDAMVKRLESYGIWAGLEYLSGDSYTWINCTQQPDSSWVTEFHLKWGDCPAGCTDARIWRFKTRPNCQVEKLSTVFFQPTGYLIPAPPNCNISDLDMAPDKSDWATVYPNPFSHQLQITVPNATFIRVSHTNGQQISVQKCQPNTVLTLDTNHWKSGIYIVQTLGEAHAESYKVVKMQ